VPKSLTLPYNEAARVMDGDEQVDTLPASSDIIERLTAFAQEYYKPEPDQIGEIGTKPQGSAYVPPASACAKC
jgi:hypothetical protein